MGLDWHSVNRLFVVRTSTVEIPVIGLHWFAGCLQNIESSKQLTPSIF